MSETSMISIELAYALSHKQTIIPFKVASRTNALLAIEQSGILTIHPEINLRSAKIGVFGKVLSGANRPEKYVVNEGDRIEIYRPLKADPKNAKKVKN